MSKLIITAAITGSIHIPSMSPYLPVTPGQIVEEAVRSWEAGASVCHIHVRDPETGQPSPNMDLFRQVASEIKKRCDVVLCLTTGGGLGMTAEQRVAVVPALKPELASFNSGSLNFGLFHTADKIPEFKFPWEKQYLQFTEDFVFTSTFKSLREFCKIFYDQGTMPEFEVYDVGMINNIAFLLERGIIKKPVYLQFVMGILGGIPPSAENLLFMYETARKLIGDFNWSVCAAGRSQMAMCTLSVITGGNVRVGLEDALYLERGVLARSNAEQVQKIARIAKELGREIASPDEARTILELKGLQKVNY